MLLCFTVSISDQTSDVTQQTTTSATDHIKNHVVLYKTETYPNQPKGNIKKDLNHNHTLSHILY